MNLREKILNSNDIRKEKLYVEEWDAEVEVRTMSGKERAVMLKNAVDKQGNADFEKIYPEIIIATCYNPEDGKKIFEPTDRELLNTKSAKCIEKIAKLALKLSGLDQETANDIEKN